MKPSHFSAFEDPSLVVALGPLLDLAIEEDIGSGDLTGMATVQPTTIATANIVAKQSVTVCGLPIWMHLMERLAPSQCAWVSALPEGALAERGQEVASMRGPAQSMLAGERIAMNLICHLTGIATITAKFVAAAGELSILDTRKTTPGQRALEKYAVRTGGGRNHRMSLATGVLIKENHVVSAGSVKEAVSRAKSAAPEDVIVECEVRNRAELEEAIHAGADAVLLDNMSDTLIGECASFAKEFAGDIFVEASGNMTLDRVASLAELSSAGLNAVSVGALTHSRPYADLSMLMKLERA